MSVKRRGGCPEEEIEHAKVLLSYGALETWGWSTPAGEARVKRRANWLADTLQLGPGVRVLECGCGTGVFTREVAKTGAEVYAADISPLLLKEARRLTSADNVTFVETNLECPEELEDGFFDAVYGVSVLHHLDLPAALKGVFAKMAPDARFAFSEPNITNPINKYYLFVDDFEKRRARGVSPREMAFTRSELGDALRDEGFLPDVVAHRDFLHPSIPKLLITVASMCEAIAESVPVLKRLSGSLWVSGRVANREEAK